MNIFQKIAFANRISKAVKKSKQLIDSKKDLAENVRKHFENIIAEIQEIIKLLPDFRNIYNEVVAIIETIK